MRVASAPECLRRGTWAKKRAAYLARMSQKMAYHIEPDTAEERERELRARGNTELVSTK